jgi:hypothetical protein
MKTAFITVRGRINLERNILFIRTSNLQLSETVAFKFFLAFAPLLVLLLILFEENGPKKYVQVLMWSFLVVAKINYLYDVLFRLSFSNRIPLSNIVSYDLKDDPNGLETIVTLQLKSGRKRILVFRTLEGEYEPFLETIAQHSGTLQTA